MKWLFAHTAALLVVSTALQLPKRPLVPPAAAIGRRELLFVANVLVVAPAEAKERDDPSYAIRKTDAEWRASLSRNQYFILRRGGTERPESSPLVHEKRAGSFLCAGCGAPLFESAEKFNSGTGWPSFAASTSNVEVESVAFEGVTGAELRCGRCGGHLGDRFLDGAFFPRTRAAQTGMRYCIDGAALVFVPADGSTPVFGDLPPKPIPGPLPAWLRPPPITAS